MCDKEAPKSNPNDETPEEGNPEKSTSASTNTSDLPKNPPAGSDTLVVATYVANEDGDCANNSSVFESASVEDTEPSDINHLLSIVRLCDGPSTSTQRLNETDETIAAKCTSTTTPTLQSTSATASGVVAASTTTSPVSPVSKEVKNSSALTVNTDCDELPYTNTNASLKEHISLQSPKPTISVKSFSPILRVQAVQNVTAPSPTISEAREPRCRSVQGDNVAGPQMPCSNEKAICPPAVDQETSARPTTPENAIEDLTSRSETRVVSPAYSSVTSVSTFRAARSTNGRRVACLRHMRRAPKEPEEYIDSLFPHIREAHNQIRKALLHAPLTDVKDNAILKRKMFEVIRLYISGCKNEFERVGTSLIMCRRLKRNILRLLDLFHDICSCSWEDPVYLYHISQLIAVYNSLEIRLSFNLTRLQKCALIHRLAHVIHKHLAVNDESLAKENILRMFLHMPDMYSARFIMEPLFNAFLAEIPTSGNTWCQREIDDKPFVQYIVVLHLWKEMLRDPLEQVELINRAQHFMCPTKTLHTNPMYVNHLPTIHTRKHAVKDILNSLKYFHDLRNAAICDDTLQDGEDDIEVVIDDVINTTPFWDFGATYVAETKHQRHINRRVITHEPAECVDLTLEDEQDSTAKHVEDHLDWLTELKERASERVQNVDTEKVICLDSDSDEELFSGSILDPTETYQDCDAVDTDYTSLDGSTTDEKVASEDEEPPTSGITPNGLKTYLAPRYKKQINSSEDMRTSTSRSTMHGDSSYVRTRYDSDEGEVEVEDDSVTVGKKSPSVSRVRHSEAALPLIVNTFTVRGKQNMHLLNSPRYSLDIGPERFGNDDMEFQDSCDDERELRRIVMQKRSRIGSVKDCVHSVEEQGDDYYERDDDNDEEEYHSLPSANSSSISNLGKVIYSQALSSHTRRCLPEDELDEERYRIEFNGENVGAQNYHRHIDGGQKQVRQCAEDKPVKKQVKFNDNPIGPTRRPNAKVPIKPAIHLSKIQTNNQPPIFASSPQPRFASPSSSTSSTTESLKQMAQKGRSYVDRFYIQKPKILPKTSSAIIIDSEDDDIIDVSANANRAKTHLTVSTQPIQSKKAHRKDISNQYLSVLNNNICKNAKCEQSSKSIHGPKDISSTNCICNRNVETMNIYDDDDDDDEDDDDDDSVVWKNQKILEKEKQVELEEQNSNVSTTTGPNLETNTADEKSAVSEKGIKKQLLAIVESSSAESCRATAFDSIMGSDICTSSTEAMLQGTDLVYSAALSNIGDFNDLKGDRLLLELTKKIDSRSELNCTTVATFDKVPASPESNDNIGLATVVKQKGGEAKESEYRQDANELCDENITDETPSAITRGLDVIKNQQSNTSVNAENEDKDIYSYCNEKCSNMGAEDNTTAENVNPVTGLESETITTVCQEPPDSVAKHNVENNAEALEPSVIDTDKLNEPVAQNTAKKLSELCENSSTGRNTEDAIRTDAEAGCLTQVYVPMLGADQLSTVISAVDQSAHLETETSHQESTKDTEEVAKSGLDTSTPAFPTNIQIASDKAEVQTHGTSGEVVKHSGDIHTSVIDAIQETSLISNFENKIDRTVLKDLDAKESTVDANEKQISDTSEDIRENVDIDNESVTKVKTSNATETNEIITCSANALNVEENSTGTQITDIAAEKEINESMCTTSANEEICANFEKPSKEIRIANSGTSEINTTLIATQETSHDITSKNDTSSTKTVLVESQATEGEANNVMHSTAGSESLGEQMTNCTEVLAEKDQKIFNTAVRQVNAPSDKTDKIPDANEQTSVSESEQLKLTADQILDNSIAAIEAIAANANIADKKASENATERSGCLEITPLSPVCCEKEINAKVEPMKVHEEIFSTSAVNSSSDGLVRLVAAVKAVEALNLSGNKLALVSENENVEVIKRTSYISENFQPADSSLSNLPATLVTENMTSAVQSRLERSDEMSTRQSASIQVEPTETIAASKESNSTGIFFCGDKSPETNLDRLAQAVLLTEAASQKYSGTVSEHSSVEMLVQECIEITKHARDSFVFEIEQSAVETELASDASSIKHNQNSKNENIAVTESVSDVSDHDLQQKSTIATFTSESHATNEKQIVDVVAVEFIGSAAAAVQTKRGTPSGNDVHLINARDNPKTATETKSGAVKVTASETLTEDNCKILAPPIVKRSDVKKEVNKLKKRTQHMNTGLSLNSDGATFQPHSTHNTGPTFHSSFEHFISSFNTKPELKQQQRKSPRTSKQAGTNKIPVVFEEVIVPDKISYQLAPVVAATDVVRQSNTGAVLKDAPIGMSLTPQNSVPVLSASPESEYCNAAVGEVETRKRCSLRQTEQWKVINNTSVRASPPIHSNESVDTKKTNKTKLTNRCIKIRLARAKLPTKAEQRAIPPMPNQAIHNLESEFGDMWHRPITRRLAAALNTSLQMETENSVIEPIKPLITRGRKTTPKFETELADARPTKRKRCENIVKMSSSKTAIEPKMAREEVVETEITPMEEQRKMNDCGVDVSLKEYRNDAVSGLASVEDTPNAETVFDESSYIPVKSSAKLMKIENSKPAVSTSEMSAGETVEKATTTLGTILIKPAVCTQGTTAANLNSSESTAIEEQPLEEAVNRKEEVSAQNLDILLKQPDDRLPIEATMQRAIQENRAESHVTVIENNITVAEAKYVCVEKCTATETQIQQDSAALVVQASNETMVAAAQPCLEKANLLPENCDAQLVDISNFSSLTLELSNAYNHTNSSNKCPPKSGDNFGRVAEFSNEDSTNDLNISHIKINDSNEDLNNTESINILKTNMEADKLLEEYNHSVRIIANANLRTPLAAQTPPDGRTPACSSVTFSYTGSDISSSSTNSCSCSTTSTPTSAADLCKNEPTSFKVVQSQAQVVELHSSASTSFQDLSLLDLEHDVIISNDDLLSELMPIAIMDAIAATSLEHNYAIKPLEMALRNEYETQYDLQIKSEPTKLHSDQEDDWDSKAFDINTSNDLYEREVDANAETALQDKGMSVNSSNEVSLQTPNLKVSIPIVRIKRLEEITGSKNWYLTEKPSTSKAALEALARRNAQLKNVIPTNSKTSNISIYVHEVHVSTDSSAPRHLLAREMCCQSPSLPLKKRRNVSEVFEEDLALLSDGNNLASVTPPSDNALNEQKGNELGCTKNTSGLDFCENIILREAQGKKRKVLNLHFTKSTPEREFDNTARAAIANNQQRDAEKVPADCQHKANGDQETNPKQRIKEDTGLDVVQLAAVEERAKANSPQELITTRTQYQHNDVEKVATQFEGHKNGVLEKDDVCERQEDPLAQVHICKEFAKTGKEDREEWDENSVAVIPEVAVRESAKKLATGYTLPTCEDRVTKPTLLENTTTERLRPSETENSPSNAVKNNNERTQDQIENQHTTYERNGANIGANQAQVVSVSDEAGGLTMNEVYYPELSLTKMKETTMQDLITVHQAQTREDPLPNYADNANEAVLTSYDDQFLVAVCLDESNDFEEASNMFVSKEYAENDFDIGNDVIISTHGIKEESDTELVNVINSPKNSPMNLTKPVPTLTTDTQLNIDFSKANELIEFMPKYTNTTAPTESADLQLFTIANNSNYLNADMTTAPPTAQVELFASSTGATSTPPNTGITTTTTTTASLNFNSMPGFTSVEFGLDQNVTNRPNIIDFTQWNELGFVVHDEMPSTQLPAAAMQFNQRVCTSFAQPKSHNGKTKAFDGITTPLRISSNIYKTKTAPAVEMMNAGDVCGSQTISTPTLKICSALTQNVNCAANEKQNLGSTIPTTGADIQHLTAQLASLSPILPLIKPTTAAMGSTNAETTPIFSFPDFEADRARSSNAMEISRPTRTDSCVLTTASSIADSSTIVSVTVATKLQNKSSTPGAQSSKSRTARNTARARAPARVQIVTPQRKNHEAVPKSVEEAKAPDALFTNTTVGFCTTEFSMNQVAAALPATYSTAPLRSVTRYANLCHFEKYIQQLTALLDVPAIIESARNLFVDKQALAEAHAALLTQATQFDNEGNAISQPLLLKYHKDGTISILNDNDECFILTANMSKMVKRLSLALSILQEQQSPLLDVRGRIHALLKQLTQRNSTKAMHGANVIPTAVVNPTNLADSVRELELNALNPVELCSSGGDVMQPMQHQLHLINSNTQTYANWHEVEASRMLTGIASTELQIASEDQLINIDPMPLLAEESAAGYEHAVAFDFDENPTILSSNESISAQRFENAFEEALVGADEEKNYTWPESEHWQSQHRGNTVSPWQEHNACSKNVAYEERLAGREIEGAANESAGTRNDGGVQAVMINNLVVNSLAVGSGESVFDGLSADGSGGVINLTTGQQRREAIKKTVYQPTDDKAEIAQPTSNISTQATAHGSKKVSTKRVQNPQKVHTNILTKSLAVSTAQKQPKMNIIPKYGGATAQRKSSTIHYRPTLHTQKVANAARKQDTTLHYRHAGAQPQQRTSSIKIPAQLIASTSNHLQQTTPPLNTIDGVKNIQLFSQQQPQNSALGGSLPQSNNARFLLTTPTLEEARQRFVVGPPALTPLNSDSPAHNMPSEEALIQYHAYQLHQTQPSFGEDPQITERQLHSAVKGATQVDIGGSQPTDFTKTNAATILTAPPPLSSDESRLRKGRSSRSAASKGTTETQINFPPNFQMHTSVFANDAPSLPRALSMLGQPPIVSPGMQTTQQQVHFQQQQLQFFPPANTSTIIDNMQQKYQAGLEGLRQHLIKEGIQRQTELQYQIVQQQPQALLRMDQSQRLHGIMTANSLIQYQPLRQLTQQHGQQQQLLTVVTQPPTISPQPHRTQSVANTASPTSAKANLARKRGRPRKYDLDDEMLFATSDLQRKRSAPDSSAQNYTKSNQGSKIRTIAAASLNANSNNIIRTTNQTNTKTSQMITTPPMISCQLTNNPHKSQQHQQNQQEQYVQQPAPLTFASESPLCQQTEQQQLRPSFTSSANAFNLIESMIIEVEAAAAEREGARRPCVRPQSQTQSQLQPQSQSHLSHSPSSSQQRQEHPV